MGPGVSALLDSFRHFVLPSLNFLAKGLLRRDAKIGFEVPQIQLQLIFREPQRNALLRGRDIGRAVQIERNLLAAAWICAHYVIEVPHLPAGVPMAALFSAGINDDENVGFL